MSDTPRMKAAQMAAMEHMTGDVYRVGCDIERELNAAQQRIKRLEDAGDYLCAAAAFMGWHDKIEAWNKAKEAKL
jgi:hypothetical protein